MAIFLSVLSTLYIGKTRSLPAVVRELPESKNPEAAAAAIKMIRQNTAGFNFIVQNPIFKLLFVVK
jgi:hypothetical protein